LKGNLSVAKKAKLLKVNRSTIYYQSCKKEDVDLMNEIRDLYEKHCFLGYRRITEVLNRKTETKVNRKKVLRLMRKMRLMAVYPKRKLSNRNEDDPVYPYLLKEKPPLKPNDCWAVDITYIRICGGYAYLTALIDWVSRRIMGWSLSPFLDASSCLEALNQGLKEESPNMINSDQGSQFTSRSWIELLKKRGIEISMDGKGRCIDNIHIERFWRSLKYEEVYLRSYRSIKEAKESLGSYIQFYNEERPHQSLGYKTPNEMHEAESSGKIKCMEALA
jgi:putative transposase